MTRTNELTSHQPLNQEAAMKARERIQIILKAIVPLAVYLGFIALPLGLYSISVA